MVQYDDTVFGCAVHDEMMALLASAPTDFAQGLVYGKMSIIQSITSITERPLYELSHH